MEIYGVGIDIVDVERMRGDFGHWNESFIDRIFTEEEKKYCMNKADPAKHLSGKYAAKEAVYKATRLNWEDGVFWNEIEILNDENRRPYVKFSGESMDYVKEKKIESVLVSISHSEGKAVAFAVSQK